jgi:hypothetical protein
MLLDSLQDMVQAHQSGLITSYYDILFAAAVISLLCGARVVPA